MMADLIDIGVKLGSLAFSLLAMIVAFWRSTARGVYARFELADRERQVLARRVDALDAALGGLPGRDDLHGIQIHLSELRGDLKTMTAVLGGQGEILRRVEATMTRHEEHLLKGERR